MPGLIKVKNINCGYYHYPVLKDISFEIGEGEFIGIIGPNGSGKSTLLRAISRCLKPYDGAIYYKEKNIRDYSRLELSREFAFVPQDTTFNFSFTVWEIVLMGRIPYLSRLERESQKDLEIAKDAMRVTDTLKFSDRQVNELSAGERQMVIITKALVQEPKVLFLDEPTSHLDIGHQVKILNFLQELNKGKKITVITVLHDLNLASEYCNKILLLDSGSICKFGAPPEVLNYENIENVYKTLVLVNKNPITGNPHVLLVRKEK